MYGGVLARTFDAQVATQERFAHVDVFDFDLDLVLLAIRCLVAPETTAGAQQRRGRIGKKLRHDQLRRARGYDRVGG